MHDMPNIYGKCFDRAVLESDVSFRTCVAGIALGIVWFPEVQAQRVF